jgi:protein involved in temperature-dependent protein secretion
MNWESMWILFATISAESITMPKEISAFMWNGGVVTLDDTTILDAAMRILNQE